jgi:sporulation protein YlmC with PRC-barrel domain
VDLGQSVLDKELVDRRGRRAGKVDDLLLEVGEVGGGELPRVAAIISGPMALSRNLPRPLRWLAYYTYRLLGLRRPRPAEIPWDRVSEIDVVVHLTIPREETRFDDLADAVNRRFIDRIPGSGR